MFLFLLILFLYQINSALNGKWEQITPEGKGLKDIIEFEKDSIIFIQEFFSDNLYKIEDGSLKILNDKNEKIVESEFYLSGDSLFLFKDGRKDKMIRVSTFHGNNKLAGTWAGKTEKGIKTYFSFRDDKHVIYKAVIDERKFKYKKHGETLIVFLRDKPAKINYTIEDDNLILIYTETNEKFEYKRIDF